MHANPKKLVGGAAIAATLGLSAVGVGAGVANAATPAQSIPGPVHTVQTDWGGWGSPGDWCCWCWCR